MKKIKVMFEFGGTHNGLQEAKELADLTKKAGADYAKVQLITHPNKVISNYEQMFEFRNHRGDKLHKPLWDVIDRRSMPVEDWDLFFRYCRDIGLRVCSSVEDAEGVEILSRNRVDAVKVASSDIRNVDLLKSVAESDLKEIHLDTGNASFQDICDALNLMIDEDRSGFQKRYVVHYCPKGYPAPIESTNLATIRHLRADLPSMVKIGFSDHCMGLDHSIWQSMMAVAMQVDYIEKGINLNHKANWPEFAQGIDRLDHMKEYVERVHWASEALGVPRLYVDDESKRQHDRGCYLVQDVYPGDLLTADVVRLQRPLDDGISAADFVRAQGKKRFRNSLSAGALIKQEYLE